MKKRCRVLFAVVLVLAIALSTFVVAGAEEKTRITILRPGDETKVRNFIEPAIAQFEAENPDIDVEIIYDSWGGWIATYPSQFQAGTQPDVIYWWDKAMLDTYANGKILPIEQYVDPAVFNDIPEAIIEMVKINDVLYHVPVDMYGQIMYYRKDVFEQAGLDPNAPPTTWEELLECCKQIAEKTDVYPLAVPGKAGLESCHEFIAQFISQKTGQPLLDENNQITFNNELGKEALTFVTELLAYCDPSVTEYARGDMRQLFKTGDVAIVLGDGVWAVPEYQATFGKDLDNTICGIALPPTTDAGAFNWCGLDGWAIAQDANAEAAGRLITFLCQPEVQFQHHTIFGGMPYTAYEAEQEATSYSFWNTFKKSIFEMTPVQRIGKYHPAPSAFYNVLEPIWQEMLLGDLTVDEALEQVVDGITEINARYGIE